MPILLNGDTGITTPGLTNTGSTTLVNLTTTGNTILGDQSTDTLNVANGNLVLNSSGNLLVGTASGTQRLTVNANMDVTNGTITTRLSQASGAALIGTSTNHAFFFMTNDTERMRLDSSGNLSVGTTNSIGKLAISTASGTGSASTWDNTFVTIAPGGTSTSTGLAFSVNTSTNTTQITSLTPGISWRDLKYKASQHIWESGASQNQAMTLDASGNLLVGATSAAGNSKGYFFANANTSHTVRITNASAGSSAYANLVVNNDAGNVVELGMQSSTRSTTYPANEAWMYTSNGINIGYAGNIKFYTSGAEQARVTSAGDFLVGGTSVGATDAGAPQINLISSVTTTGQWSGRIVSRNTGNNTAVFLGNYKSASSSVAGVFAHPSALNAWSPLYVNTVDGTASNCGDVVVGNKLLVNRTSSAFTPNWGVVAVGLSASLVGPQDTNAILCANAYYSAGSQWTRVNAGVANILEMTFGATNIQFFTSGSSSAGSAITYTSGPYIANGSNTWTNGSDARLKNITGEIQNGLSKVMTLRAAEFTWKHDADNKPCVGLIAQDVQAVLPEAIDESSYVRDDDTKYLGVNYDQTIPLLVAAIKELKSELDSVKTELAALKGN